MDYNKFKSYDSNFKKNKDKNNKKIELRLKYNKYLNSIISPNDIEKEKKLQIKDLTMLLSKINSYKTQFIIFDTSNLKINYINRLERINPKRVTESDIKLLANGTKEFQFLTVSWNGKNDYSVAKKSFEKFIYAFTDKIYKCTTDFITCIGRTNIDENDGTSTFDLDTLGSEEFRNSIKSKKLVTKVLSFNEFTSRERMDDSYYE